MAHSRPYRDDIAEAADGNRGQALQQRAVAQLARRIISPRPHGSIALNGQAMSCPASNRPDAGQPADLDGSRVIGRRSIAQLSIIVGSPGPDGSIRLYGKAMVCTCRDRGGIDQAADLYRRMALQGRPIP